MSEIKRGDLVMVVKPKECCGMTDTLGEIFTVSDVAISMAYCPLCGTRLPSTIRAFDCADSTYTAIERLKKIDPPATGEYDGVAVRKTQPKEVTA